LTRAVSGKKEKKTYDELLKKLKNQL